MRRYFLRKYQYPNQKKNTLPKAESVSKRKYERKGKQVGQMPDAKAAAGTDEAIGLASALFEETQLTHYYMVKSFIELVAMVAPENRHKLAQILEGIISK